MPPDVFQALPEGERSVIEGAIQEFQKKLQATVRQIPRWDKERREKVREVNREVMDFAVGHLIETLRESYKELPGVIAHLDAVQADVIDNVAAFIARPQAEGAAPAEPPSPMQAAGAVPNPTGGLARRYQVNVVVDNSGARGAPVIYEDNPALGNLVGVPREAEGYRDVYYTYTIQSDRRDDLAAFLEAAGIETKVQHPLLMPQQPAYRDAARGAWPRAEQLVKQVLCLPASEKLSAVQQDAVIEAVQRFFAGAA